MEWSLRAFASMGAVRLSLRARAVINFLMQAASSLELTNGEHWALCEILRQLEFVVLRQVIWLRLSKQDNRHITKQLRPYRGLAIPSSSLQPIIPSLRTFALIVSAHPYWARKFTCIERARKILNWTTIGQMAIVIALLGFNDLGSSVTLYFFSETDFIYTYLHIVQK